MMSRQFSVMFVYSFSKHLFGTIYVPDTILGPRNEKEQVQGLFVSLEEESDW